MLLSRFTKYSSFCALKTSFKRYYLHCKGDTSIMRRFSSFRIGHCESDVWKMGVNPICHGSSFSGYSKFKTDIYSLQRFGKRNYSQKYQSESSNSNSKRIRFLISAIVISLAIYFYRKRKKMKEEQSSQNSLSEEEVEEYLLKYKEEVDSTPIEERREKYHTKSFVRSDEIRPWKEYAQHNHIKRSENPSYEKNDELNQKISLYKGSICRLEVDAIQNAANYKMRGGGGIDASIHGCAGYKALVNLSMKLYPKGCNTGCAKITPGLNLPSKWIIHAVGPVYVCTSDNETLANCYQSTLNLVEKYEIKTVALCCVSTGVYEFPVYDAAEIAIEETRLWLEKNKDKVDRIIFCVYNERSRKVYEEVLPKFFPL